MDNKKKIKLPAARAAVTAYHCTKSTDGKPIQGSESDPLGMYTGLPNEKGAKQGERPTQDADDL